MHDVERIAGEGIRPLHRSEYDRLVELGIFDDERLELLFGRLVRMSPQGALHAEVIERLHELLLRALAGRARVRTQSPLALSDDSEPGPDVAVVPRGNYVRSLPATALLVVEVADSSLRKDRVLKTRLYAAAGIPEYWIVNLATRAIEVHTLPSSDGYRKSARHGTKDVIRLRAFPDASVPVSSVIPAGRR